MDIEWILGDKIIVRKISNMYHVESFDDPSKVCDISFSDKGRMLFDGQDIDTEAFMGYVGLIDSMDGEPEGKPVVLEAE